MEEKLESLEALYTHRGVLGNKNKKAKRKTNIEKKLGLKNGKLSLVKRKKVEISRVRVKRDLNSTNMEGAIKEDGINNNTEIDTTKSRLKNNKESGITLIALVVTIVVLLILTGISISMLTGENSIVRNAQKAKIEIGKAEVEEKVRLAVMGAYDSNGSIDVEKLKAELDNFEIEYSEEGTEFFIEIPNGKQVMVSKTTGDIREGVHKIAYNYNGGEDIGEVPSDDTEYKEGENITIKFSPVGEREGFEFLGWSTSAGATEAEYTSTGTNTITMERRSITLYAVWRGIPHTISYNANTGIGAVPTAETAIKGQDITVNFTPLPTKTGYTFVGWSEDKTSDNAEYTSEAIKTIKMPAKDVTLYAIWIANKNTEYKVEHYQMDTSGIYPTTATGSNTYTNGTTDAKLSVADLKENYAGFTYRYGQVNGTTVEETTVAGDGSRVIKLYYERNKYTVNYNVNGGNNLTPTSANGYHGATITLPTPTRTGYTFNGWFTQATGGAKLNATMAIPVDGTTIYAQWIINKYKITYVGNGGSTPTALEANYGANITMETSTREGYTFNGWYTQATNGTKVNYTTMPANSVTVYAQWKINQYTLTFNGNGGSTPNKITANYGSAITMRTSSRTGYTFNGWFTATSGGSKVTYSKMPAKNQTLYAQWTINKYKITYVGNGGTTPTALEANYGTNVALNATSTRTNYTFLGWFDQQTGGNRITTITMPVGGKTVYAQWSENNQYTIGQEVTVGGEKFFVIENNKYSQTTVKLLSKFNLNQAGTAQQNARHTTTACKFSWSNYWITDEKDLNYDHEDAIAYKKAKTYGTLKGGRGRLLTSSEMWNLCTEMSDKMYGKNIGATDNYLLYWVGTSRMTQDGHAYVWGVAGDLTSPYGYEWSLDQDCRSSCRFGDLEI